MISAAPKGTVSLFKAVDRVGRSMFPHEWTGAEPSEWLKYPGGNASDEDRETYQRLGAAGWDLGFQRRQQAWWRLRDAFQEGAIAVLQVIPQTGRTIPVPSRDWQAADAMALFVHGRSRHGGALFVEERGLERLAGPAPAEGGVTPEIDILAGEGFAGVLAPPGHIFLNDAVDRLGALMFGEDPPEGWTGVERDLPLPLNGKPIPPELRSAYRRRDSVWEWLRAVLHAGALPSCAVDPKTGEGRPLKPVTWGTAAAIPRFRLGYDRPLWFMFGSECRIAVDAVKFEGLIERARTADSGTAPDTEGQAVAEAVPRQESASKNERPPQGNKPKMSEAEARRLLVAEAERIGRNVTVREAYALFRTNAKHYSQAQIQALRKDIWPDVPRGPSGGDAAG